MENATKALLIGAGMLFAVVVVSMVLYTYNQITTYYNSKQDEQEVKQQAEFNIEFSAYDRDDVTGFELVSLINKIINYNAQNVVDEGLGFDNTDKYWTKMEIKFTITDKNLVEGELFKEGKKETINGSAGRTFDSEYSNTNTKIEKIMDDMHELENTYSAGVLSKLVSNVDSLDIFLTEEEKEQKLQNNERIKTVKEVLGKEMNLTGLDKEDVIKYGQYIDFKRAEFESIPEEVEYDTKTGRLTKLSFIQKDKSTGN